MSSSNIETNILFSTYLFSFSHMTLHLGHLRDRGLLEGAVKEEQIFASKNCIPNLS